MDTVVQLQSALTDRYHIERELGQGDMATVYLAEDLKHKAEGRAQGVEAGACRRPSRRAGISATEDVSLLSVLLLASVPPY